VSLVQGRLSSDGQAPSRSATADSELAELLSGMPDVGVDADFQRQDDPVTAADFVD
jgi:hypothetical protein